MIDLRWSDRERSACAYGRISVGKVNLQSQGYSQHTSLLPMLCMPIIPFKSWLSEPICVLKSPITIEGSGCKILPSVYSIGCMFLARVRNLAWISLFSFQSINALHELRDSKKPTPLDLCSSRRFPEYNIVWPSWVLNSPNSGHRTSLKPRKHKP